MPYRVLSGCYYYAAYFKYFWREENFGKWPRSMPTRTLATWSGAWVPLKTRLDLSHSRYEEKKRKTPLYKWRKSLILNGFLVPPAGLEPATKGL